MSSEPEPFVVERIKVENLLDLPDFILEFILLKLTFCESLAFSMLSKRANRLMHKMNMPPLQVLKVEIDETITITANEVEFCIYPLNHPILLLRGPHINVRYTKNERTISSNWVISMRNIRGFLANLFVIGRLPEIQNLDFGSKPLMFPMSFIKGILEGLPIEEINMNSRQQHVRSTIADMRNILNNLPPARKLYLTFNPFKSFARDDPTTKTDIMRQRNDFFAKPFDALYFTDIRMNLDDLFLITSKKLLIFGSFSPCGLNLYLKYWLMGGAPNLVILSICNGQKFRIQCVERLLRGIHYVKNKRTYITDGYLDDVSGYEDTKDGFDFCGQDGTVASIFFDQNGMDMYVWPLREVIIQKKNPSRLIIHKLNLHFNGDSVVDSETSKLTVFMKEGSDYHFGCSFQIQREPVKGLRFCYEIARSETCQKTVEHEIGNFQPLFELQDYDSPSFTAPKGVLERGEYEIKSYLSDDHDNHFVEYEWTLVVVK